MSQRSFAVFDIDGTLIRWQLYHAMVDKLAGAGLLGPDALDELRNARRRWKNREHPESFKEYETFLVQRYELALPNVKPAAFDVMVNAVINEYKEQVYTYTRDLIRELKAQKYVLLAISGSHQELVKAIAEHYGFDDCVGTEYVRQAGKFSGEKILGSADKKRALEKMVAKHNLTYQGSVAVGDSLSDASMLTLVGQPIAFNPDRDLFDKAKQARWQIVVERKNVVYELKADDGQYLLA
jgi:HAD superfamily hydrolase (TIGR01490 family)